MENRLAQYKGRVLAWRERNGYHDSDFFALVGHDDGTFEWIEYATTRYYCPIFIPDIDATEQVRDRYAAFWWDLHAKATESAKQREQRSATKGRLVHVAKGRKHKGVTGTLTWWGTDQFKSNRFTTHFRAGIDTGEEMIFVPASYLQVQVDGEWVDIVNASRSETGSGWKGTPEQWVLSNYPHPELLPASKKVKG